MICRKELEGGAGRAGELKEPEGRAEVGGTEKDLEKLEELEEPEGLEELLKTKIKVQ